VSKLLFCCRPTLQLRVLLLLLLQNRAGCWSAAILPQKSLHEQTADVHVAEGALARRQRCNDEQLANAARAQVVAAAR
jgi:hypothetical protein